MSKAEILAKIEDLYAESKLSEIETLNKVLGYQKEEEKKTSALVIVFAILGVVVAVAAVAYLVYRYFEPDYLEDFEDDFDDDFDDEFFEDDDTSDI